jgi:opacity protein-like surface antigen
MSVCSVRRLFIVLVFLAVASAYANATDFTVFVGGAKPGKVNKSGILTSLDSSPVFGVRLSTNFVPSFGMEHTLAFSSDYLFPHNTPGVTNTKGFVYSANLIVSIPLKIMTPYATAGVGLIKQYGSGNPPVGTKFAFNYGGGLKFPKVIGPMGLRFDARGYTATGVFSSKLNILEVSGGILFSF